MHWEDIGRGWGERGGTSGQGSSKAHNIENRCRGDGVKNVYTVFSFPLPGGEMGRICTHTHAHTRTHTQHTQWPLERYKTLLDWPDFHLDTFLLANVHHMHPPASS